MLELRSEVTPQPGTSQWARRHGPPRASSTKALLTAWSRTNSRALRATVPGPRLPLLWVQICPARRGLRHWLGSISIDTPPANRRTTSLEFVHREIDALAIESLEGALETVLGHEPDQVAVLAAGKLEEPTVRALRSAVDGRADQLQKVGRAMLEPSAQGLPGFGERDRPPEE